MKKNTKDKKDKSLICGQFPDYIRKMYFSQKMSQLLNEIQASDKYDDKDFSELMAYLTELRAEESERKKQVEKVVGYKKVTPPTVQELFTGTSDEPWREKADKIIKYVQDTLDSTRRAIKEKQRIPETFWLDTAVSFISYQDILEKDKIFKTQLYYAKITNIIDNNECSRLEAENRAHLTKEYSDYKYISLLLERINEFIMLCKKKDAEQKRY